MSEGTFRTVTGKDLFEAFRALDKELPASAYKPIQGGKGQTLGLTDISPGYLPEVLMELFGPIGLGWGFQVVRLDAAINSKNAWEATARVAIWYRYTDGTGLHKSDPQEAPGGSDNSEREWAEKGAITNALGTAWFFAGYQTSVFKGLRSHTTVRQPAATAAEPGTKFDPGPRTASLHQMVAAELASKGAPPPPAKLSTEKLRKVQAAVSALSLGGANDDEKRANRLNYVSGVVGRKVGSTNDLTEAEADKVIADARAKGGGK